MDYPVRRQINGCLNVYIQDFSLLRALRGEIEVFGRL